MSLGKVGGGRVRPNIGVKKQGGDASTVIQHGPGLLPATVTGPRAIGNFVIGNNVKVVGTTATNNNFVYWSGGDYGPSNGGPANVNGTLTLTGTQNIAIVTGSSSSAVAASNSQAVWLETGTPTLPGATAVSIGSGVLSGASSVSIGPSAGNSAPNSVAIGSSANPNTTSNGGVVVIGYNSSNGGNFPWLTGIGAFAYPEFTGEFAVGGPYMASQGDRKTSLITMYANTTNATQTELGVASGSTGIGAPNAYIKLANNATYHMKATVIGRNTTTAGSDLVQTVEFVVTRDASAATTAIVGTPAVNTVASRGTVTGWAVSVTADTTNGRPAIKVTGAASTNISWACKVEMLKVI